MDRLLKSDDEWKKILTPEEFQVTRKKGRRGFFRVNTIIINLKAHTIVNAVVQNYLCQIINLTLLGLAKLL